MVIIIIFQPKMFVVLDFKGSAAPPFASRCLITSTWPCHSSPSIHNAALMEPNENPLRTDPSPVLVHNMQQALARNMLSVWGSGEPFIIHKRLFVCLVQSNGIERRQ